MQSERISISYLKHSLLLKLIISNEIFKRYESVSTLKKNEYFLVL